MIYERIHTIYFIISNKVLIAFLLYSAVYFHTMEQVTDF